MTDRPPADDDATVRSGKDGAPDPRSTADDAPTVHLTAEPNGEAPLLPASPEPTGARGRAGGPADSVGERYELGPRLGAGGMATVHLAADRSLGREVAVKILHPDLVGVETAIERFFDEATIMATLEHPGALPVFDAGRLPGGAHYYSMQRVRGRTLKALLEARTPSSLAEPEALQHLVDLYERVCQTVAAAHAKGIIHRDLKPENVMVDDFGAVYVMDWGLAKRLPEEAGDGADSQRTRLGVIMGTPAYMAPEQAAGQSAAADRQSDVFSLGVMLYEILTGTNPFRAESARESMKGVQFHTPDPPRRRNPRANRNLSAVCMKAIEKDPFRRYPSAVELAEDLRRHAEHLPVSAIRPRLVDRLAAWSRRRPRLATAAATLTLVAVLLATVAGYQLTMEGRLLRNVYGHIDRVEGELAESHRELERLAAELGAETDAERVGELEQQFRRVEAKVDAQRDILQAMALSVTGFTLLSPDARAQRVVHEQLLVEIEELVQRGENAAARERIEVALGALHHRHRFGLDRAGYERLEATLERLKADLEVATGPE